MSFKMLPKGRSVCELISGTVPSPPMGGCGWEEDPVVGEGMHMRLGGITKMNRWQGSPNCYELTLHPQLATAPFCGPCSSQVITRSCCWWRSRATQNLSVWSATAWVTRAMGGGVTR